MNTCVLLVDPDESIIDAFLRSLARHGFEVLTASNERDSVRNLCESAPSVLVLEPDTGEAWGHQLLTRQHPRKLPAVPTVVVSRLNDEEVQLSSELPIHSWHTKPVKTSDLIATISQVVSLSESGARPDGRGRHV